MHECLWIQRWNPRDPPRGSSRGLAMFAVCVEKSPSSPGWNQTKAPAPVRSMVLAPWNLASISQCAEWWDSRRQVWLESRSPSALRAVRTSLQLPLRSIPPKAKAHRAQSHDSDTQIQSFGRLKLIILECHRLAVQRSARIHRAIRKLVRNQISQAIE